MIIIGFFSFSLIEIKPEPKIMENQNISMQDEIEIPDTSPEAQAERRQVRQEQVNLLDSIVNQGDYQRCSELSEASIRNLCYNNIAYDKLNLSICNYINSETGIDRCLLLVSVTKGSQEKSLKVCDNLFKPDLKQRCLDQLQANNFCITEDCL